VRVLQEQHAIILGQLTRHDQVMTELKQVLSGASNNANRRDPIPPEVPANQTTQRVNNNTLRGEFGSDRVGGSRPGLNKDNDPFKEKLLRFMKELNARMDKIPGAPPVLKGPNSEEVYSIIIQAECDPRINPEAVQNSLAVEV